MIVNIFQSLKNSASPEEAERILRRIDRFEMFQPVMQAFSNWLPVVKFILFAFSWESDLLEIGSDWEDTRRRIANKFGVEKGDEFDSIVNIKHPQIAEVVNEYLMYQGRREFRHLTILRQLYDYFLSSTFTVEDDQKFKNAEYAEKTWKNIMEYEQAVKQTFTAGFVKMREETLKKLSQSSLNLEDSSMIR